MISITLNTQASTMGAVAVVFAPKSNGEGSELPGAMAEFLLDTD